MKELWRRLAALGLTLCLSLSILAVPAQAAPGVPALRTDHVQYMQGFPEGDFQPNGHLTRAQAAQMIYRLLESPDSGTLPCSYRDVGSGKWYDQAVIALCRLGLLEDGTWFRPNDIMTRAEFVALLVRLRPDASGQAYFTDVPASHWAYDKIGAAVALGWINGFPDGTFGPSQGLTRAQACTVINRMTDRHGDADMAYKILALGLYSDVSPDFWGALAVAEASVSHTPWGTGVNESWTGVDFRTMTFTPGFHEVGDQLCYVGRDGVLVTNQELGAYYADYSGSLTQYSDAYAMENVPYYSQIDDLYAWVGCESVATFTGLRAKGYAWDVDLRTFVTDQPRSQSDPEKGFVGDPFVPDKTKKTRTTIYPAKLAEYSNSYCWGEDPCADFRGADITDLQRELLAGNCVVGYMTLWWKDPFYLEYNIEGRKQWLVSNNHAVLVYGYDPEKGYLISDPYNYDNRGEVYQYWEPAEIFEPIWTERKVGMVIR